MTDKLSKADVEKLLQDPSANVWADAAAKIATHYGGSADFGESEKKLAEEMFSIMCRDAEERVRAALSDNLKDCEFLPHDLALTLAEDVALVSKPILTYSSVLTDDDLMSIVESAG